MGPKPLSRHGSFSQNGQNGQNISVFTKIMRFLGVESWAPAGVTRRSAKSGQNGQKWSKVVIVAKSGNKVRNASFDKSVLSAVMGKGSMSEMSVLAKNRHF